jgi:sialic acid synthase SpsE|tara:strand:- start:246 stop:1265 length:1020 start_codon:yes stop_codon:yes gene_type:complete
LKNKQKSFKIGKKFIGKNYPAFIIAEAGINHNGKLKFAKKLIDSAKKCNVDAIKFQTFKADDFTSTSSPYYKLFKKVELSDSDFGELSDYANQCELEFLSTPFSNDAVELLSKLKVSCFKISSGDLTHLPLIKYASSKNKPILLSTGMGSINEIKESIKEVLKTNNQKIGLFHSISSYPTPYNQTNMLAMQTMMEKFVFPIGYSDNGSDMIVPEVAISLGAKLLEKHFTLDKKMKGPDHKLSASPIQMKELVQRVRQIEEIIGDGQKKPQKCEMEGLIAIRRGIITKKDLKKGETITANSIKIARPAKGIEPKFFDKLIGRKILKNIPNNTPLKWNQIK